MTLLASDGVIRQRFYGRAAMDMGKHLPTCIWRRLDALDGACTLHPTPFGHVLATLD